MNTCIINMQTNIYLTTRSVIIKEFWIIINQLAFNVTRRARYGTTTDYTHHRVQRKIEADTYGRLGGYRTVKSTFQRLDLSIILIKVQIIRHDYFRGQYNIKNWNTCTIFRINRPIILLIPYFLKNRLPRTKLSNLTIFL